MSLREYWQAAQEQDQQPAAADGAGHRRYAKAWELHKLGVPVMSPNGGPDPALTEAALDGMLAAEQERRAALYRTFVRAEIVMVFRALDVQIRTGDDIVYTIGNHDPLTQTNSSRPLGLLAGAEAIVTDASHVRCHGRSMLLPLPVTVLDTKSVADAAVVFPDGTVHIHALHGNAEVRKAQKQVARFNVLAGTAPPESTKMDPGHVVQLQNLHELREAGLLSREEYAAKRAEIIASL
jgi:hypothetical protein